MTALDQPTGVRPATGWVEVCPLARLTPDRGVAALVEGRPVAVFRLSTGELHALDNVDPCTGVGVLSRGVVGDVDGSATVASPLHKQRFELATGRCLDADVAPLAVHDALVVDDAVLVRLRHEPIGGAG